MPQQHPGDEKMLERIDAAVNRFRKQIRVDSPYFLTSAAKDTAFRPSPYNWHKYSFFELDEEHLQHQTWRYREEQDDLGCLTLHGGIEEERRREEKAQKSKVKEPVRLKQVDQAVARRGSVSGTDEEAGPNQSANGSPRRKKTSWQEYRKKKLNGGVPSDSPDPTAHNENASSRRFNKNTVKESSRADLKANGIDSRDHGQISKVKIEEISKSSDATARALKAVTTKKSTHSNSRNVGTTSGQQPGGRSPSFDLPDLHSPIHFDDSNEEPRYGFPALLSPLHNLPKQFQEDLEAHKAARKRAPDALDDADTPENKRVKATRDRTDSSLSSSSSQSRNVPEAYRSHPTKSTKETKSVAGTKFDDRVEPPESIPSESASLIVRLRYGRNKRKDVDRILRARADSKLQHADGQIRDKTEKERPTEISAKGDNKIVPGATGRERSNTDGKATFTDSTNAPAVGRKQPVKATSAASSSSGSVKRPREEEKSEHASSNKRQQTSGKMPKEPETPKKKAGHLSPLPATKTTASGKSLPKNPTSALKDSKSVAMQRNRSQDTVDSTPRTTQVTPVPPPRSQPPSSTPHQNGATPDTKPLTRMNDDLAILGKQLKNAFDRVRVYTTDTEKSGHTVSASEWKRGALSGLESLVAYILMFSATHAISKLSNRPPSSNSFGQWHTMMPLFHLIKELTRRDDHLRGLHAHIGLGIAHHITKTWTELSREQKMSDHKVANGKYTCLEVLDGVLAEMPGWSEDAYKFLGVSVVEKEFPSTWKGVVLREDVGKGEKGENELLALAVSVGKERDKEKDGKEAPTSSAGSKKSLVSASSATSEKYCFPLLSDCSSLQVCRFVVSMLREYAAKEKLEYSIQVRV